MQQGTETFITAKTLLRMLDNFLLPADYHRDWICCGQVSSVALGSYVGLMSSAVADILYVCFLWLTNDLLSVNLYQGLVQISRK